MKIKIGLGLLITSCLLLVGMFAIPLFNWTEHGPTLMTLGMAVPMLTKEEEEAKTGLLKEIKTQVEDQLKVTVKKDEVTNLIKEAMKPFESIGLDELRAMVKADTGVMSILQKQGAELTALKANGGVGDDLSLKGQVAAWNKKNKDVIAKAKNGQRVDLPEMELKTASPMTPSNTLNSSSYLPRPFIESGLHDIRRIQPTFWDYIVKGRTSQAAYVWVNKTNPLGNATFIGPGVAKNPASFELTTEISNAKKIAVSLKVATELLDDIEGMTSFIQNELSYQLRAKINTTLMTGVLSSTIPAGIQTFSTVFSLTGLHCVNPNDMDAIRAVVAQIRHNYFEGPITVFINPVDAANMNMAKASTNGVYLLPPFANADGTMIGGAEIVEDNNVTAGYFQAAVLDLFKCLIYKDYTVAFGWENDDFTKNLVTVIGEMRIHSFHSNNDANAFIYDRFTNVKMNIANS